MQCIALVTDLNDADALVIKIFELFYRMVGKNKALDLDFLMTSILSQLLQEMVIIPPRVVDIIISHFLSKPPESTQKDNHSLPVTPGYIVSKTICTDNIDVMTRHVNQYFADIMTISLDEEFKEEMEKSDKGGRSKVLEPKGKSAQIKAQELAVEIWMAVPELLVNIIGQLEQDLSVDNLKVRELATISIGKMLGHSPSRVNFVKEHFTTWKAWVGRIKDKSPQIRISWTKALPDIIKNRTDVLPEICLALADRLNDPDEKVRLISCSVFSDLKNSVVATKLNNKPLFDALYSRLRDKKTLVRHEAFAVIGSLFENAYSQIESGNEVYISLFGPIPQKILDQLFLNDKEINERIDATLNENIFVVNSDDTTRTIRFLTVLNSLNEQGTNAYNAILKRQFTLGNYVGALGTMIREYNDNNGSDNLKAKIDSTITWLSNSFAEPSKAKANLQTFFEKASDRACKLLSATVNPESDYNTVQKAVKELFSELKGFKSLSIGSIIHTFTVLFYRSSYSILNRSSIMPIVEVARDESNQLHHTAQTFLKTISASQPTLMKSHVHELVSTIENSQPGFDGSVDTMKTAISLAERFQDLIPQTSTFFGSLVKIALDGTPEEATQAIRLISFSEDRKLYFNEVMAEAIQLDLEDLKLPTHLASIAELYTCLPDLIETRHQEIQTFLTQKVLLFNTDKASATDPEWVDDDEMPKSCQSKILALRVLVNRLKQVVDPEVSKELSRPVFSLLASLIGNMGEIVRPSFGATPLHYRARLRLESGLLFLQLASSPLIEKLIRPQEIIKMASLVQDGVFQIRQRFLHTLMQYWSEDKIPRRFVTLVFVAAFEPKTDLLHYVSTWIRARVAFEYKGSTRMPMEKTFSNLLHLLVHHQESFEDVETTDEQGNGHDSDENERAQLKKKQTLDYVLKIAAYIVFYLGTVATEENISMIFYISQRLKQYRDNVDETLSDRMYLVSDVAQFIIIKYQEFKGWNVDTWPGKLQLSADIFKSMPSSKIALQVAKTTYLPDYAQKDLEEFLRKRFAKLRKQHADLALKEDDGNIKEQDTDQAPKKRVKGPRKTSGRKAHDDDGSEEEADQVGNGNGNRRSSGRSRKRKTSDDDAESSEYGGPGKRRKSAASKVREEDNSSRRRSSRVTSAAKKSLKEDSDVEMDDDEDEDEDEDESVNSSDEDDNEDDAQKEGSSPVEAKPSKEESNSEKDLSVEENSPQKPENPSQAKAVKSSAQPKPSPRTTRSSRSTRSSIASPVKPITPTKVKKTANKNTKKANISNVSIDNEEDADSDLEKEAEGEDQNNDSTAVKDFANEKEKEKKVKTLTKDLDPESELAEPEKEKENIKTPTKGKRGRPAKVKPNSGAAKSAEPKKEKEKEKEKPKQMAVRSSRRLRSG